MKGLLKGFQWPFRLSKSVKYSQSYGPNEVYDNIVHYCLEYSWTVSHTKEYYQELEQSVVGIEYSLPFISGLNIYVVEVPVDIKLGEVLGSVELQDKFRDQGKRVLVFDHHSIKRAIVLD